MSKYIRNVRIPVFLLVLIVSVPLAVAAPGSESKPNIVLVLMDNFGYGEIGVYGGGVLRLMSRMVCSDDDGRPAGFCFISTPQIRMDKDSPLNQR
jgi:arylsulfatase A-like enzyme